MMTGEQRENAWRFCTTVSTRLPELCTRNASFRGEITRLYQNWQVDAVGTDAKARLLLSLALYSLILDHPRSGETDWEEIATADILERVVTRPTYELFASLPSLGREDEGHVQALKFISYQFGTSAGPSATANYWAHLITAVSRFLEQVSTVSSEESPTCKTILLMAQ
ncbi:hypothetical protein ACQEVX_22350 [Streptomyces syringium]|uniref:hypothetical protein n=1 Tax=Streptomyces syringium TaxID=76729 RepID=UPI003D8FD6BE